MRIGIMSSSLKDTKCLKSECFLLYTVTTGHLYSESYLEISANFYDSVGVHYYTLPYLFDNLINSLFSIQLLHFLKGYLTADGCFTKGYTCAKV
jgi:hypothetical protein